MKESSKNEEYHKRDNNTVKVIWNTCYNAQWILDTKEVELLIKEATKIANKKYGFKKIEKLSK